MYVRIVWKACGMSVGPDLQFHQVTPKFSDALMCLALLLELSMTQSIGMEQCVS